MHEVVRNTYDHYSIWTASDAQGTPNEGYPKSWFYFEVGGFINRKVSFSIHRVHFLYAMVLIHLFSVSIHKHIVLSIEYIISMDRFHNGIACPIK